VQLEIAPGERQVFFAHTRWGAGGLIAAEHTWGELVLELPATARGHDVIRFGAGSQLHAEYRQGHSIVNYLSDHLVGSVEVVALDGDDAELRLDLRATEPSIDIAKEGAIALSGRVDAERAASAKDCD
jgi:hypothetical protein